MREEPASELRIGHTDHTFSPSDERRVQATISRLGQADGVVHSLHPNSDYLLQVQIGLNDDGSISANAAFPEKSLRPSPDGHSLQIVYCPLSAIHRDGAWFVPTPMNETVHLPPRGVSSCAQFILRSGEDPSQFRARLIVMHSNRVLQTLLVEVEKNSLRIDIIEENKYSHSLGRGYQDEEVDLAFVVNDNPDSVSGITTIAGPSISFIEPTGLKASIAAISEILSSLNLSSFDYEFVDLGSSQLRDTLVELAMHGAVIAEELERQHPLAQFDSARHVQVLEAVDDAYLPVEFFYSGGSPDEDALMCPNASEALRDGSERIHNNCPNRNDDHHVCPLRFWGLRKCIERYAHTRGGVHQLSEPTLQANRIGPFNSALLAVSEKAADEVLGTAGLHAAVSSISTNVEHAQSWPDVNKIVQSGHPQLMLLLPHSGHSPNYGTLPALEISSSRLVNSNIKAKYVVRDGSDATGPLVLLLGCSTALASIDYLNAVRRFHRAGAPVVLGTLAMVDASQASLVARRMVEAIRRSSSTANSRFFEVLLQLKRQLLSEGHGVAIGLISYGHSSWRI